jgi:hypothetical protein
MRTKIRFGVANRSGEIAASELGGRGGFGCNSGSVVSYN